MRRKVGSLTPGCSWVLTRSRTAARASWERGLFLSQGPAVLTVVKPERVSWPEGAGRVGSPLRRGRREGRRSGRKGSDSESVRGSESGLGGDTDPHVLRVSAECWDGRAARPRPRRARDVTGRTQEGLRPAASQGRGQLAGEGAFGRYWTVKGQRLCEGLGALD